MLPQLEERSQMIFFQLFFWNRETALENPEVIETKAREALEAWRQDPTSAIPLFHRLVEKWIDSDWYKAGQEFYSEITTNN